MLRCGGRLRRPRPAAWCSSRPAHRRPRGAGDTRSAAGSSSKPAGFPAPPAKDPTGRRGPSDSAAPDGDGRDGTRRITVTQITIITEEVRAVEATPDPARGTFLIDVDRLPGALGWELKPSGLCQEATCVPVADVGSLRVGEQLDLVAVAGALGRPAGRRRHGRRAAGGCAPRGAAAAGARGASLAGVRAACPRRAAAPPGRVAGEEKAAG